MPQATRRVFDAFGLDFSSNESIPFPVTPLQMQRFRFLRILIGCIWLYNTWNFSSGATKHAIAHFPGLPFSSFLVHLAGTAVMFVGLYLALALISGNGLRFALWIGTVFLLIMWIWGERGGDFNPATGGTDARVAPSYLIALILTYLTWRISQPFAASGENETHDTTRLWMHAIRVMFGFLWAWDAMFKLHPYFLTHNGWFHLWSRSRTAALDRRISTGMGRRDDPYEPLICGHYECLDRGDHRLEPADRNVASHLSANRVDLFPYDLVPSRRIRRSIREWPYRDAQQHVGQHHYLCAHLRILHRNL